MSVFATADDYNRAPVGHPFMEACGTCGNETGVILLKTRGRAECKDKWSIPRMLPNPDAQCEFCDFLGKWFAHENSAPAEGVKYGAAKLVEQDESSGERELVAFVPFASTDCLESQLADGTKFTFRHGMVIGCVCGDGMVSLAKILEQGV